MAYPYRTSRLPKTPYFSASKPAKPSGMAKQFTASEIARALGGRLIGDGHFVIDRVAHPADVQGPHDLVLATDKKLLPLLIKSEAAAAIIGEDAEIEPGLLDVCIIVSRPRYAMAKLTNLFAEAVPVASGIHPSAIVEPGAQLGENVSIGPQVYIASGAAIGANSIIHPQVYIGPDVVIGKDALIYAGAKIGARVHIGDRCIIHFNASIGADGFSFVTPQPGSVEAAKSTGVITATNDELVRIASLGAVIIGDDAEIGANTSIDRGTIASTRIGNGTKIDNQVQVGHNVVIGDNCLICGRVGIAGSAQIGNRVVLGGGTGIADHVKIGDDAVAMAMSGIAGNVPAKSIVGGFPAKPRERAIEEQMHISRLKFMVKKIESLTTRLDSLEGRFSSPLAGEDRKS
jgi:UDP-3-O-[3-hydroxymyristoyl] glucosamine N-acyltransferase